jgi:hypothetical protein
MRKKNRNRNRDRNGETYRKEVEKKDTEMEGVSESGRERLREGRRE